MPSSELRQGDVVRVPFPYTIGATTQHRPALVVSRGEVGAGSLWVVMITSAANRGWPGDVSFGPAYEAAGLPAPSVVRSTKIATIDAHRADRLGRAPDSVVAEVLRSIRATLGG